MTQEEYIKGNKIIADFMGYRVVKESRLHTYDSTKIVEEYKAYHNDECILATPINWSNNMEEYCWNQIISMLKYHTSWDLLMPVVDKIEIDCKCNVYIYGHYDWKEPNRCLILGWKNNEIVSKSNDSKIEAVWLAVVEFIKWYNQNK